tara:strand:+ start:271 stop:456 length:186 start_codon:yes stop_codon:yes gene_type:complete
MELKKILEVSLNNLTYIGITVATLQEWLPMGIGCIGGLALAWYNIEKALKMRQDRKREQDV